MVELVFAEAQMFTKILDCYLVCCLYNCLLRNSLLKIDKIAKPLLLALFTFLVCMVIFRKLFEVICMSFKI
jgi:hypothetical protein